MGTPHRVPQESRWKNLRTLVGTFLSYLKYIGGVPCVGARMYIPLYLEVQGN